METSKEIEELKEELQYLRSMKSTKKSKFKELEHDLSILRRIVNKRASTLNDMMEKEALPKGTYVRLICECQRLAKRYPSGDDHDGIWIVEKYNVDVDDYYLVRPDTYPRIKYSETHIVKHFTYATLRSMEIVSNEIAKEDITSIRSKVEQWIYENPEEYENEKKYSYFQEISTKPIRC